MQKTAYVMRISDWSSDVCSSDLFDIAYLRHVVGSSRAPYADQSEVVAADADGLSLGQSNVSLGLIPTDDGHASHEYRDAQMHHMHPKPTARLGTQPAAGGAHSTEDARPHGHGDPCGQHQAQRRGA